MHEAVSVLLTIGGIITVTVLGWRGLAWVRYLLWSTPKSVKPANVVAVAAVTGSTISLSQRQDIAETRALSTHQEFEKYLEHLGELDREKEQREELMVLAKARRRGGVNVLKEAYLDNRAPVAGPLTTFIALSEQQLATMKRAKAEMEKASGGASASTPSPNVP